LHKRLFVEKLEASGDITNCFELEIWLLCTQELEIDPSLEPDESKRQPDTL
jgi:hypothetical protein